MKRGPPEALWRERERGGGAVGKTLLADRLPVQHVGGGASHASVQHVGGGGGGGVSINVEVQIVNL